MTAIGGGAVRLAQQAFGELTCFQGRDEVSLAFEEHGGFLGESGGVRGGSGQLAYLGEVQQPAPLQLELVRGRDGPRRRRERRFGLVDASLPGLELSADAAPMDLGREVVRGSEALADPGELG